MKRVAIRTISITVKLSPEDWQLLQNAAEVRWCEAPITKASLVAGLAKIAAKDILAAKDALPRKTPKKS